MVLIDSNTELSQKHDTELVWQALSLQEQKREAHLMAVYAARIDRMDQNIGRVVDVLAKKGQLQNTVILFLSNNGACPAGNLVLGKYAHPRFDAEATAGTPASFTGYGANWANVSNTPFRLYKSRVHEGGIATPFIAWYPQRFAGGRLVHETGISSISCRLWHSWRV